MTDRHADTTGTQPDDDAYVAALTAEGDVARLARERDEARAEAARCREALERIAQAGEWPSGWSPSVPPWRTMAEIARQALGGGDD